MFLDILTVQESTPSAGPLRYCDVMIWGGGGQGNIVGEGGRGRTAFLVMPRSSYLGWGVGYSCTVF